MALNPSAIINIERLSKTYQGAAEPAIRDLNLSVSKGEIFGLLGPNGAGKTTTISIMSGLLEADSGTITMAGMNRPHDAKKIRNILGIVPQDIALYPSLTAIENLTYFGSMYNLSRSVIKAQIHSGLDRLGLDKHAHKRISSYSGGMKRRLNLLAGILHSPEILILDEPTVGVDVQSRKIILDLLIEINRTGTTLFYTSHHLEEAQNLCSRIAIIDNGYIISQGPPLELIASTPMARNLEDVFLALTGHEVRD